MKRSSHKKKKFVVLTKQKNDVDKIINFFMNNSWHKIGISEMEELKRFQGSTLDTISRRKLVEFQAARVEEEQRLLHEQLSKQNWDLREAHEKSLSEMEELKRFQGSTFDTIARRRLF